MEIFDVKYNGQTVQARLRSNGSVYIRLPERDGGNGSHYIESIEKELDNQKITLIFHAKPGTVELNQYKNRFDLVHKTEF